MKILFSEKLLKDLSKIKQKNPQLYKKIKLKLKLFSINPNHPSLRLHKLTGNLSETWSISVDMSIRMVFVKVDSSILFVGVGSHDKVYK